MTVFFCGLVLRIKIQKRWTSLTDYVDFCSVLHGLQIAEYSIENEYGYVLSMSLDSIRKDYRFDETCQGSVPQAVIAFLESTDFEDAIQNAISIGGDSDTIAAITGSIAEAAYGIPEDMKEKAYAYLDEPLKDVLRRWKKYMRGVTNHE